MGKRNKLKPENPKALAAELAEALRRLAAGQTRGFSQVSGATGYRLVDGRLLNKVRGHDRLFQFRSGDGAIIPQDIKGEITTGGGRFKAVVRGQSRAVVWLEVETAVSVPENIPEAELFLNRHTWLTNLAVVLDGSSGLIGASNSPGAEAFQKFVRSPLADGGLAEAMVTDQEPIRMVMDRDSGRYISRLGEICRNLAATGKSVLVCAGTNERLDSILEVLLGTEQEAKSALAAPGPEPGIIRLGLTRSDQIPESMLWEDILYNLDAEKQRLSGQWRAARQSLEEKETRCREQSLQWTRLDILRRELGQVQQLVAQKQGNWAQNLVTVDEREALWKQKQAAAKKAARAWVGREAKRRQAVMELREADVSFREAEDEVGRDRIDREHLEELAWQAAKRLDEQEKCCQGIPEPEVLRNELASLVQEKEMIEQALLECRRSLDLELKPVLDGTRMVFATFPQLMENTFFRERQYDCVVAADACRVLVPLTFWVASLAGKQVILGDDGIDLAEGGLGGPWASRPADRPATLRTMEGKLRAAGSALLRSEQPLDIPTRLLERCDHKPFTPRNGAHQRCAEAPAGLVLVDTPGVFNWSGKQPGTLSNFNVGSALVSIQFAAQLIAKHGSRQAFETDAAPCVLIVAAFKAQAELISAVLKDLGLISEIGCTTLEAVGGVQADWVVLDTVVDVPHVSDPRCSRRLAEYHRHELRGVLAVARRGLAVVGSSAWMESRAHPESVWGELWGWLRNQARIVLAGDQVFPVQGRVDASALADDLSAATRSIWGVVPALDNTTWQAWGRSLTTALNKGVKLTLISGQITEAADPQFADHVTRRLRNLGAVVNPSSGWPGYEFIIDDAVFYGLRPREITDGTEFQRIRTPRGIKCYQELIQTELIQTRLVTPEGAPRTCPLCGWPVQLVNQIRQHGFWDDQPVKVGCLNDNCRRYLRNLEERLPFREVPHCRVDDHILYERVRRGRGQVWQCPVHPEDCPREKYIPGDPG
jgi:hypothetical protein